MKYIFLLFSLFLFSCNTENQNDIISETIEIQQKEIILAL